MTALAIQNPPTNATLMAQTNTTIAADSDQFITFTVGEEEYGINIMLVREIKAWTATTRLPNTPDYMRGVINLRGAVVPIFDLRGRFNLGLADPTKNHVVIILNVNNRTVGILVDRVSDILTVEQSAIQPPPHLTGDVQSRVITGLVTAKGHMVMILAPEELFDAHDADQALTQSTPSN